MSLINARRIIKELRDSRNILYQPQFTGDSRDSDALDLVRMKLLDCLVWIELSDTAYDNRLLGALRDLLNSILARRAVRVLQGISNVAHYQEEYRDELVNRLRDIRRLVLDIPP